MQREQRRVVWVRWKQFKDGRPRCVRLPQLDCRRRIAAGLVFLGVVPSAVLRTGIKSVVLKFSWFDAVCGRRPPDGRRHTRGGWMTHHVWVTIRAPLQQNIYIHTSNQLRYQRYTVRPAPFEVTGLFFLSQSTKLHTPPRLTGRPPHSSLSRCWRQPSHTAALPQRNHGIHRITNCILGISMIANTCTPALLCVAQGEPARYRCRPIPDDT